MIKFILGILFVEVGLPLIDSAVELAQLAIEKRKSEYAKYIAQANKEVHKITHDDEEEKESPHAIGFYVPQSNEEEESEDEDI